jgi:hypothetical protein
MGDEHAFQPDIFLPPVTFRRRMEILEPTKCNVLAWEKDCGLLGKLPPRSVSITFDDGWADFVNEPKQQSPVIAATFGPIFSVGR